MNLSSILVVLTSIIAIIALGWLVYAKAREENFTRERYAFRCLAAALSLVLAAVTAISSHKGFSDHFFDLAAGTLGLQAAPEVPAPFSEKILIVLLVAIAVYLIMNSYKNWGGLISEQEAERKRTHRPSYMTVQAFEEVQRLVKRLPQRIAASSDPYRRVYEIPDPPAPEVIWHEHARELFELWYSTCAFPSTEAPAWDQKMRCWFGQETRRKLPLFLFCWHTPPTSSEIADIEVYVNNIIGQRPCVKFLVHRDKSLPHSRLSSPDIEILSEDYLLDNIVDFTDYFNDIRSRVTTERAPDTGVTIRDIYTPSAIATLSDQFVSDNLGTYLDDWARQPTGSHLAILGEYGQGKSTGALVYAYDAIESKFAKSGSRVPILLELRGKSPVNLLPDELLGTWAQRYKIHAVAMMKLLIAGRLLIIFEGFDEMANVSDLEARLGHFKSLWKFALPKSKIIFTGRRNLFFADQELQLAFKGAEGEDSQAKCNVLQLRPFDINKVRTSLRWTGASTTEEIVETANNNTQILEIVSRPSLLYIVATLWPELRPLFKSGRITSSEVIDKFIFHSYQRQAEKGKENPEFMRLSTTERRYFHEGLAVYMASQGTTNQIMNADLAAATERLYEAYPDDSHIADQIKFETDQQPLKKRLSDRKIALDVIGTDVRTHGILVNDPSRHDTFKFAHKSFYELLFGKAVAFYTLKTDAVFYGAIRHAMDDNMGNVEQSRDVMRFFSEVLVSILRETHRDPISVIDIFDIITGASRFPPATRRVARVCWLVITRAQYSPVAKIMSLLGLFLCSLLVGIGYLATAKFYAESSSIAPFFGSARLLPFAVGLVAASLMYFVMLGQMAVRRPARRWAAVLFFGNYSYADLQRWVGTRAATRLAYEIIHVWGEFDGIAQWTGRGFRNEGASVEDLQRHLEAAELSPATGPAQRRL